MQIAALLATKCLWMCKCNVGKWLRPICHFFYHNVWRTAWTLVWPEIDKKPPSTLFWTKPDINVSNLKRRCIHSKVQTFEKIQCIVCATCQNCLTQNGLTVHIIENGTTQIHASCIHHLLQRVRGSAQNALYITMVVPTHIIMNLELIIIVCYNINNNTQLAHPLLYVEPDILLHWSYPWLSWDKTCLLTLSQ